MINKDKVIELALSSGLILKTTNLGLCPSYIEKLQAFANALIGDSEPVGEVYNKNQKYVYMNDTDLEFQHGTKLYTKPPSLIAKEAECERYRKALIKISCETQDTNLLWWQVEAREALGKVE